MSTVEIQYCVPCGHLERAIELQRTILEKHGQGVEVVGLRTGDSGVFTVSVDDDLVFDKESDEFDADSILERIDSAI